MGNSFAHDDQGQHDKDLKLVLFKNQDYLLYGDKKKAFQLIADAASICIDQFSTNTSVRWKSNAYEKLDASIGLNIPFEDIDLNRTKAIDGTNITANTHRRYTHLGWDFSMYPNKEFWATRKKVLTTTVEKVLFSNDSLPLWLSRIITPNQWSKEQINAFSAFVYYVHLVGDHVAADKPEKLVALDPLVRHNDLSSPGIIPELIEYLQVLFPSQKNTRVFITMREELEILAMKAAKNYHSWGGINSDEKCKLNESYAKKLLELLSENMPTLLKNEDYFSRVFYN